jgi:hypothetical protein
MPAEKNIHLHPQETNKPYRRIGTIPYRYWDCAGFASKLEISLLPFRRNGMLTVIIL